MMEVFIHIKPKPPRIRRSAAQYKKDFDEILDFIRRCGPVTKKDIQFDTVFSARTIELTITYMMTQKLIKSSRKVFDDYRIKHYEAEYR